jgi:hypothetical protein
MYSENNHLKKESEELRSDKKELLNEIDNFKALARILIQQNKKLKVIFCVILIYCRMRILSSNKRMKN